MDKVVTVLQALLDGLTAGIKATGSITGGTKDYADATNTAAGGTGKMGDAFKTIFNYFAGLFGFGTLK